MEKSDTKLFGLELIKCDGENLIKQDEKGNTAFTIPLREILELEPKATFKFSTLGVALACAGAAVGVFTFMGGRWLRWFLGIFFALVALVSLADLRDKFIVVTTKNDSFNLEVIDTENDKDIRGFVITVISLVKELKKAG